MMKMILTVRHESKLFINLILTVAHLKSYVDCDIAQILQAE